MEETKTMEQPTQTQENEETPKTENVKDTQNEKETTKSKAGENEQPNVNDLMVEIAKLKRSVDKASSEAKEWKEKFRSTQSEKEILDAEKAEAQAKRDEEFESMKKTIKIHDLTENFMDLGYPKDLAKKSATAQVEGDTQALLGFQKQFQESQKKTWESEFLASRPDINIGGGSNANSYTKEQFDNMSLIERSKLKRENEAEYNRLLAL